MSWLSDTVELDAGAWLSSAYAGSGPLAGPDYEGTIRDFLIWLAEGLRRYQAGER